jgi:hypothetical protein
VIAGLCINEVHSGELSKPKADVKQFVDRFRMAGKLQPELADGPDGGYKWSTVNDEHCS